MVSVRTFDFVAPLRQIAFFCALALPAIAQQQSDFYRTVTLETPAGVNFEASGLAVLPDGRLAVALRKGEVWMLNKPSAEPPTVKNIGCKLFASGLHEILGLAWHDGALYATQRAEVTRLSDTDGDGAADEYLTAARGWGVSGNYHEYAYGPIIDRQGNLFTTLNASMGKGWKGAGDEERHPLWRGWCVRTSPDGRLEPWCAGFRSPSGIGADADGEIFVSDQQGNWMPANPIFHIRQGAFFGHADSLPDMLRPESPVKHPGKLPENLTVAEAMGKVPGYCPPAVWLPYLKMGQSTTGLCCDTTAGKFGPFAKQMFAGEFVIAGVNRVFLEKIGGEFQGACFPFIKDLQCAALALSFLPDGSMIVGQTNRGWNSTGNRPFGLQRIVWTGKTPFEIQTMEAIKGGFRYTFTEAVDAASLPKPGGNSFDGISYTYPLHSKYGGDELNKQPVETKAAALSQDGMTLELQCGGLRAGHVHEFRLPELRSKSGQKLWHREAFYTLNRLP